jgi:hypothetical protein
VPAVGAEAGSGGRSGGGVESAAHADGGRRAAAQGLSPAEVAAPGVPLPAAVERQTAMAVIEMVMEAAAEAAVFSEPEEEPVVLSGGEAVSRCEVPAGPADVAGPVAERPAVGPGAGAPDVDLVGGELRCPAGPAALGSAGIPGARSWAPRVLMRLESDSTVSPPADRAELLG